MRNIARDILIFALAAHLIAPVPAHGSSGPAAVPLSIAVVPVSDGDMDERSGALARDIGGSLKIIAGHRIVEPDLSADVIGYGAGGTGDAGEANGAAALLASAKEHFFKFQHAEAERDIGRAIALFEAMEGGLAEAGPGLRDAYISRTVFARARGDMALAKSSLAAALRIDPALTLSAEDYQPSLVSLFEEERGRLKSGPAGSITVKTSPPAADVFLNGIRRGPAPIAIEGIPPGTYDVTIAGGRYSPIKRIVEVKGGEALALRERLHWAKRADEGGGADKEDALLVREGIRIAGLMKTDKVLLVDADSKGGSERIEARLIDRRLGVGQPPVVIAAKRNTRAGGAELTAMARNLADQAARDIGANPAKNASPLGVGDPSLLGKRRRPIQRSPVFWGIIGALAAGAVGGGIAAALAGGGSGGGGGVRVSFR